MKTEEFAHAIVKHLPPEAKQTSVQVPIQYTPPVKPTDNVLLSTPRSKNEKTVGVDIFVDSPLKPAETAKIIQSHVPSHLQVVMLSNRGTQVWPTGSLFTECVNHYRCRIELKDPLKSQIEGSELFELVAKISKSIRVCSLETLLMIGEQKMYTLAQGQ